MEQGDAEPALTLDPNRCIAKSNRKYASECTEVYLAKSGATACSENFKHFVSLEVVWLSGNRLSRIEHLENCFRIREVYVEDNRLVSLAGLRSFSFLRVLLASNNQLRNLEKQLALLSRFAFLKKLDLFGNPVAEEPDYRLQVIYHVPQVEILDQHSVKGPERSRAAEVVPNMDKVSAAKAEKSKRKVAEHSTLERSYLKMAHDIQDKRRPKAAVDSATWVSTSDASDSRDVTAQVNALIKTNWITNFTGKQALGDALGDPHASSAKKLVVTKGVATRELHEASGGGPPDNVFNLSPLFAQVAVDRAIWASISDPSMLSDATAPVNSLIFQHKANNFTKGKALVDVLGNPHPGHPKKLLLSKGGSLMELREPGDGGPANNVYDLSKLYEQGPALPASRTHKENRERWAKRSRANLDPARPTTSERSDMHPLITKRAGKTALTRKDLTALAEDLSRNGLDGRLLADPTSVFDPPAEAGGGSAANAHPLEAIMKDSATTMPVDEVANWLLTLEWPQGNGDAPRGRQGGGRGDPRGASQSKGFGAYPQATFSTLQMRHGDTCRTTVQPLGGQKTRADIFPMSFLHPRRKIDEIPHSTFTMPLKATVGFDDAAANSQDDAGTPSAGARGGGAADAQRRMQSNKRATAAKRRGNPTRKNLALGGALRFDATLGDVPLDEARTFMPPGGAELTKDRANSQWVVTWKGRGSHSRNWTVRPPAVALREVLQWAWEMAFSVDGAACNVEGIFVDDGDAC